MHDPQPHIRSASSDSSSGRSSTCAGSAQSISAITPLLSQRVIFPSPRAMSSRGMYISSTSQKRSAGTVLSGWPSSYLGQAMRWPRLLLKSASLLWVVGLAGLRPSPHSAA